MNNTAMDFVATEEIAAEIAHLANDIVSKTLLAVEDMFLRIGQIAESAGVVAVVIRAEVKEQVHARLQSCGSLPLRNDRAYQAL
jgi:ribosomal protein L2